MQYCYYYDTPYSGQYVVGGATGRMAGGVTGRMVGGVTGRMVSGVTGRVARRVTGRMGGRVTGRMGGRVTGRTGGRVTGRMGSGVTGQMLRIRPDQVINNAGGAVFQVSDEAFVRRFLILGTTGGTYYVDEKELTIRAAYKLCEIIEKGNGLMLLNELVEISLAGRSPRQNAILFALALCACYKVRDTTSKASEAYENEKPTAEDSEGDSVEENDGRIRYGKSMDASYQKKLQQLAYLAVPKVCRIPTHLFMFIKYCKLISSKTGMKVGSKGWGRALRATVSNWYLNQSPERLVMQVTKYRNREGYTHRDLFRLSHIHPSSALPSDHQYWKYHTEYDAIFKYIMKVDEKTSERKAMLLERWTKKRKLDDEMVMDATGQHFVEKKEEITKKMEKLKLTKENHTALIEKMKSKEAPTSESSKVLQFLEGFQQLQKLTLGDVEKAVELIKKHGFVREHIPSMLLSNEDVWKALLVEMPMTALIRNLGKMTAVGLLDSNESNRVWVEMAVDKLKNEKALKEARIHPLSVLIAQATYMSGGGYLGNLKWTPNPCIINALEEAFYKSFHNVTPTNKRYCLALDISGSMGSEIMNLMLSCSQVAAALCMSVVRTEPNVTTVAFSNRLTPLTINGEMKLMDVLELTGRLPMSGTDCALPMIWAAKQRLPFDVFIVYTDNETWYGNVHPSVALQNYRLIMDIPEAKLIVLAMTATDFTIADPLDPYMLDICGVDSSVPELIKEFVCGNLS